MRATLLITTVSSSLDRFKSAYLPQKWRNKKKTSKKKFILETEKEYHTRRINEIEVRIKYLTSCIEENQSLKHIEKGIGKSYLKRRNTRISQNNNYRLSQWKSEVEGLERVLISHKNKL